MHGTTVKKITVIIAVIRVRSPLEHTVTTVVQFYSNSYICLKIA